MSHIPIPTTSERCKLLLTKWREELSISNYERSLLKSKLKAVDHQIARLMNDHFRVAVFGRVGVGKSSLLNALLKEEFFSTDVAHGSTSHQENAEWHTFKTGLKKVELIDTPGIDEIGYKDREIMATNIAIQSDLILLVLDSDITSIEIKALKRLLSKGKPLLIVLNRSDQWSSDEKKSLVQSIKNRLPLEAQNIEIQTAAASPRKSKVLRNGSIRAEACSPQIKALEDSLIKLLRSEGRVLISLNTLHQAAYFSQTLKRCRLKRNKIAAQSIIGKFAAIKASGVAANPLWLLDLAGGYACDTALIIQLGKLYGLHLGGYAARELIKKISIYNSLLGGVQIAIQVILSLLRHILILAAPFSSGLTFGASAPVALAQAAFAIHTTKKTGKLAAREFLNGNQPKELLPDALLKRLAKNDPKIKRWLVNLKDVESNNLELIQSILP